MGWEISISIHNLFSFFTFYALVFDGSIVINVICDDGQDVIYCCGKRFLSS